MAKLRTIGCLIVALLVLLSPLPAMCGQCRFMIAAQNCSDTHRRAASTEQADAAKVLGEHCQHVANSQSSSLSHFLSRASCQDRSCQQLLNSPATVNRLEVARFVVGSRAGAPAEVSDDPDFVAAGHLGSNIEIRLLSTSTYQSLFVSLRI